MVRRTGLRVRDRLGRMTSVWFAFPIAIVMVMSIAGVSSAAQTDGIWSGVYTDAQAARGKTAFGRHCSTCHIEDLSGGQGPSLAGERFMNGWQGSTLGQLFDTIRTRMPRSRSDDDDVVTPEAAASVSDAVKLDIVAYILQANAFPAGPQELTLDTQTLAGIDIVPKGGLRPPTSGAFVEAVGCLAQDADKRWVLTRSSVPVGTRSTSQANQAGLRVLAARPLGTRTIALMDVFPTAGEYKGRKVTAKGFYMNVPTDTINVLSLQVVSPTCGS